MRASMRREIRINRSADDVWAIVGKPEILHTWFPGLIACRVEGNTRTITTATNLELAEEILTNDPVQRRFQYSIVSPLFSQHLGTIDVIDLGDSTSLVVYSTDADPGTMALTIAGGTAEALEELRSQLENGA